MSTWETTGLRHCKSLLKGPMLHTVPFLWSLFPLVGRMNFVNQIVSQLCPKTLLWAQNKNPRAVRPNMLLPTTSPSTSNLLHFVLSALVRPAFLLFLQHTKLVLNEPDPDSRSLHLLFPLPGISFFTEVSASLRTAFSD